jgi:hypothetical protein
MLDANNNNNEKFIDIDIDSENESKKENNNKSLLRKSLSLPVSNLSKDVDLNKKKFKFNLLSGKQKQKSIDNNDNNDVKQPVVFISVSNEIINNFSKNNDDDEDDDDIDDENLENDLNEDLFEKTFDNTLNSSSLRHKLQAYVTSTPIQYQKEDNLLLKKHDQTVIDGLLGQIYDRYNSSCSIKDSYSLNSTSSYLISDSDLTQHEFLQPAIDHEYERKKLILSLKQKSKRYSS